MAGRDEALMVEYPIKRRAQVNSTLQFDPAVRAAEGMCFIKTGLV